MFGTLWHGVLGILAVGFRPCKSWPSACSAELLLHWQFIIVIWLHAAGIINVCIGFHPHWLELTSEAWLHDSETN
eukprot:882259-Amphidinium_carterae.1